MDWAVWNSVVVWAEGRMHVSGDRVWGNVVECVTFMLIGGLLEFLGIRLFARGYVDVIHCR